jgi:hypothetical protein
MAFTSPSWNLMAARRWSMVYTLIATMSAITTAPMRT